MFEGKENSAWTNKQIPSLRTAPLRRYPFDWREYQLRLSSTAKFHSSITDVVAENFNDETANNWTLQGSLRPTTHQVRNLRTKKSQLKKAANFKFFKAYNKSLANEIISRINEFVDRFQKAKEDVDC